ncbi:MAG: carboxypeptidase regulatory-like domain-containing protein [Calditrichaeota bacterium]|nr:carboxypeptidase regulatory-like domain-containing protein [Calditrichota bacterium]MCB9367181.1 carboxypeptidase regulatory-like domain-containing protein [Calditrichota bacterium]
MTIRRLFALLCAVVTLSSVASAIEAPTELTIAYVGTDVVLRWQPVAGATEYNVYKETDEITDVSLLFPAAMLAAPTTSWNDGALTIQHYYVVTAVVPSGDASGVINDTTGLAYEGVLVWVSEQGSPNVTGMDYTDANGFYEILDLPVGTYDLCLYKENRPVHMTTISISDGNNTAYNYTWPVFSRTHIAAGILAPGVHNWTNGNVYEMDGIVRVGPGATLNIEEGTTVNGSSVIVSGTGFPVLTYLNVMASTTGDGTDNGVLNISGSKYKPVVFTSGRLPADGPQRNSDWGGLIIDGDASTNRGRLATGEGGTGPYGNVSTANDGQSSGTMRYFRDDYAGFNFTASNQLNGICMQGVGSGTVLEYWQSYQGEDDGIEFFGGTCNASYGIITDTGDDGFDYTSGWRGHADHVWVTQRRDVSDRCIEADNHTTEPGESDEYDAQPRSNSRLANFTCVGGKGAVPQTTGSILANPRAGTQFNWFNMLMTLGRGTALDMDNSPTHLAAVGGASRLDYSLFWDNGGASTEVIDPSTGTGIGDGHFTVEDGEWNLAPTCSAPAAFPVNSTHIAAPTNWAQDISGYRGCGFTGSNATTVIANPMLIDPANAGGAYDARPQAGSPALNSASVAPAGVLSGYGLPYSSYIGAFSGPNDDWHIGWSRKASG